MNNSELLLRQGAGHLAVYYDTDRLGALPDEAHFDFRVHARDNDFRNYTEGISPEPGKCLYMCSTAIDLPTDGRLSRKTHVSGADFCPNHLVPGELLAGAMSPAFFVRITAGALHLENPAYLIPLAARRTNWHYYISGPGIVGADLYVAASGKSDVFEYRGEVELPNGRQASHFRSRSSFPLLHEQPVYFSLRERYNGHLIVRKLPTPSPRMLSRENIDGEEVLISQMFINL